MTVYTYDNVAEASQQACDIIREYVAQHYDIPVDALVSCMIVEDRDTEIPDASIRFYDRSDLISLEFWGIQNQWTFSCYTDGETPVYHHWLGVSELEDITEDMLTEAFAEAHDRGFRFFA